MTFDHCLFMDNTRNRSMFSAPLRLQRWPESFILFWTTVRCADSIAPLTIIPQPVFRYYLYLMRFLLFS
jgi:hypothetical protein